MKGKVNELVRFHDMMQEKLKIACTVVLNVLFRIF